MLKTRRVLQYQARAMRTGALFANAQAGLTSRASRQLGVGDIVCRGCASAGLKPAHVSAARYSLASIHAPEASAHASCRPKLNRAMCRSCVIHVHLASMDFHTDYPRDTSLEKSHNQPLPNPAQRDCSARLYGLEDAEQRHVFCRGPFRRRRRTAPHLQRQG